MIDGVDSLLRRLERYEDINITGAVNQGVQLVQQDAKNKCQRESGELQQSIMTATDELQGRTVGICYTNKLYAPYVEFGTGPKGQKNHNGISPDIPVAYTQSPWWIHESMIDRELAEKYHWFHIDTPEGCFYQCTGQSARPFLYPALKDNEDKVKQIMIDEVKEQLK